MNIAVLARNISRRVSGCETSKLTLSLHNAGCARVIALMRIWKFYFQTFLYMHIAGFACDTALMRIWKFYFQTFFYMHIAGFACDTALMRIWKFYFQTFLYMHIAGFACDTALMRIWKFYFQTFLFAISPTESISQLTIELSDPFRMGLQIHIITNIPVYATIFLR